ncbi:MAG: hypothetical protein KGJ13_06855 [Patescibacteria group bacterium]|nr:hypothetical protein [Patescibacteria group bacterium]
MSANRFETAHRLMIDRMPWEEKQRIYSTMRHEGLRRRNKPFPTAADSHYPSIDMSIRKQKPFWLGQVMTGNRLASFVSMKQQVETLAEAAADWFNFRLFQKSNFIKKIRSVVDTMLLRGRGVLKITIDPFKDHRLVFESIDPMWLLVPDSADDLHEADEFVHIQQWTVGRYKANRLFNQDPGVIDSIRGAQQTDTLSQYVIDKQLREGITHSTDQNRIVLWEHWVKTAIGWTVYTYCPQRPEVEIRQPYGCPYKNLDGETVLPFVSFQCEVKDEGWFSPRGLGELLAPVEAYMTKLWNEKADGITFSNRPVLTSDGEIPNIANLRWRPGEIIPMNLRGVQMPAPPISYDQELLFASSLAEQQAMTPDFGISDLSNAVAGKPRTATENERISALQSAGMNDNAMMFRESLTACYRLAWSMLVMFKADDFSYFAAGNVGILPEDALHSEYLIFPDGSPDGWNRQKKMQMAVARLQAFQGNPNVSMEELTKEALQADDPRLALKAFIPTNQKANSEAEQEAIDILVLKEGYPAAVMPGEDHATRIMVDLGWLMKQGEQGKPVDPVAIQRVQQHMAVHFQYLKKTDPAAAKQVAMKIAQAESQPMAPQPQPSAPPNGGPAPLPNSSGSAQQSAPKESIQINYKDAPPDIQRQMEAAAGFRPSQMPSTTTPTIPQTKLMP